MQRGDATSVIAVTVAVRGTPRQQADLAEHLALAHLAQHARLTAIWLPSGSPATRPASIDIEEVGLVSLADDHVLRAARRARLRRASPVSRRAGGRPANSPTSASRRDGWRDRRLLHGVATEQHDADDAGDEDDRRPQAVSTSAG